MDFNNEDWTIENDGKKIIIKQIISGKFIFRCENTPYNKDLTNHITVLHNNRNKNYVSEIKNDPPKKYVSNIEKLEPIVSKNKIFGLKLLSFLFGK